MLGCDDGIILGMADRRELVCDDDIYLGMADSI